jgi:chorismate mutase
LFLEDDMTVRGVRGATTVDTDQPDKILAATQELLEAILRANPALRTENIASAFFTTTDDLVSVHPALAARQMGWNHVPMICACEIPVPGGLPRCIRVLIHWNTECEQNAIRHIYLHEAAKLRPDLS